MNKIIITGHGLYATGIMSALTTISGPKENIIGIDFTEKDTDITLCEKFKKNINNKDNYLILCDLIGGTPYKEASKLSLINKNIKVVTGVNLGAILDLSMKMEKLNIDELAKISIESSNKNLKVIELKIEKENHNEGI